MPPRADPVPTPTIPLHTASAGAWPAGPVLLAGLAIALLVSTQYLAQPFVWRHWPWDEVLLGWLEVLRDRAVVAVSIGLMLVAASRLPIAPGPTRIAVFGSAVLIGATAGELGLRASGMAGSPPHAAGLLSHVLRWSIVAACIAAMWHVRRNVVAVNAAAHALELRRAQVERQAIDVRLESLRGQIEPHFLFNTLATMRRLMQVDPTEGARLVAHFVRFLRSAQPARDGGHLQQEIDLVSAYLGVVAQRMDGRLQVRFDVAEDLLAHPFPPLTIATLVENAIKHGIAPAPGGGTLAVTVHRVGDTLEASVIDSGVGFSGHSGTGIGLANVRARLQTLYGGAGALELHSHAPSGVRATLCIPFQPPGPAA
jgi:hypothetical protein